MPLATPPAKVLLISRNDETARDLQRYFASYGIASEISREFSPALRDFAPSAFVVFPDEFQADNAEAGLSALMRSHPDGSLTIVTRDTQRFIELGRAMEGALSETQISCLRVLPRPAFSWTILENVLAPRSGNVEAGGFF